MNFELIVKIEQVLGSVTNIIRHYWWKYSKHRQQKNVMNFRLFSYLSFEMLQSMTVFLLVFTIRNGSCMAEFGFGGPRRLSLARLRSTKFLKEICERINWCNCCVFALILSIFFFLSFSSARHSWRELVGKPNHLISFFSFEIIFIAIKTFKASYTRLLIFFWSYCYKTKNKTLFLLLLQKWEETN
mgnify:CR=1 FL=1